MLNLKAAVVGSYGVLRGKRNQTGGNLGSRNRPKNIKGTKRGYQKDCSWTKTATGV